MAGSGPTAGKTSADGNGAGYFKKSFGHFQPNNLTMLYSFIQQIESQFPIQLLCEVFHISRSAYYAYKAGKTYQMSHQQVYESAEVKKAFLLHKRRYGTRRLVTELQEMGLPLGRKKVRSFMKIGNLVAIQPKSFVPRTTDLPIKSCI